MSLFSGGFFSKEKFKNSLNSITQPIKNLADNAKHLIAQKMEKSAPKIEFNLIHSRIFWMAYPTKEKSKSLSNVINTQFKKHNYFIWNVSEHKYETALFENQVAEYCFVGYPCPPLQYIFIVVRSVIEWLNADPGNVAIIHCQASKGRSALVISCLLSVLKVTNHPMEALSYFCTKLRLEQETLLFPPQLVAIRNFANIMDDIKVSFLLFSIIIVKQQSLHFKRVTLSEVPKITRPDQKIKEADKDKNAFEFKPYIQIFKGSQAIYNYLTKDAPKSYKTSEGPVSFPLEVELTEEILVRCRHFVSPEDRVSVCRLLFHPMMAHSEILKFAKRDIEISPDIEVSDDFYIEMEVKFTEKDNQELLSINKLKEDCQKAAEVYIKKKDKYLLPQTISVKKPETKVFDDDINPLQEVYDKTAEEPDISIKLTEDKTPEQAEKVTKIMVSIEKEDEKEDDDVEEDAEEYLRRLENQ